MASNNSQDPELGLVAHYNFNKGFGPILEDLSVNGNDGKIEGAQWVKRKNGYCLEFNGIDSYVNCGTSPSFNLQDAVTLEAWVLPEGEVHGEAGLLGKNLQSYFLSFYKDKQCYWYINKGGNHVNAHLTVGSWHHLVGTFDGTTVKLYIDNQIVDPPYPLQSKISQDVNIPFLIGVTSPPNPAAPHFQGLMDEVKVYNRALSACEVQDHFQVGKKELEELEYNPVRAVKKIQQGKISVSVGTHGQVQIGNGTQLYLVESTFSYPGSQVGWNHLTATKRMSEPEWIPTVNKTSPTTLEIEAEGKFYHLRRRVQIQRGKIHFEDQLTNLRALPTGLIVWNRLTAPKAFKETFTPEFAENPTIFLAAEEDAIGVLAQDDLARLHFEPSIGLPANQARFRLTNFALDVDKAYTIRWTVYLLAKDADYFDFVNRIRQDWSSNFTMEGPFAFINADPRVSPLNKSDEELYKYLKQKHLKIVALNPFLDYDPGTFGQVLERQDYKGRVQAAMKSLRDVDPEIKCLGSLETDWVTIYPDPKYRDQLPPPAKPGEAREQTLTPEQTRIIDQANSRWQDSVRRNKEGNLTLELYNRGGNPQTALGVYPAVGNYQYAFLLDQVKFLLDEVGLDGIYFDQFSLAWWRVGGMATYPCWDGWSAEIDQSTGTVDRKYTDCSLVGIAARVKLCQYILNKGKIVVANSWATSQAEQVLPIMRFAETWAYFNPAPKGIDAADFLAGAEPEPVPAIFRGNLASPIGLGTQKGKEATQLPAERLMKSVIAYLRHGMLYYHYHLADLSVEGTDGEYGPINHLFPITPVALHKGWIEGKERIITTVSGTYQWHHPTMPRVYRFDLYGRETNSGFLPSPSGMFWEVEVAIKDWEEIVVIA